MEIYQKYRKLQMESHIFSYTGKIGFHDVILLKELTERILSIEELQYRHKKKVINILIEALQNINVHGLEDTSGEISEWKDCMMVLSRDKEFYSLVFGNYIRNSSTHILKNKLGNILGLSFEELKRLYMEMLDRGEISAKGGAGLGLIRIFLDCNKNSSYHFYRIDEDYSYFILELKVTAL